MNEENNSSIARRRLKEGQRFRPEVKQLAFDGCGGSKVREPTAVGSGDESIHTLERG